MMKTPTRFQQHVNHLTEVVNQLRAQNQEIMCHLPLPSPQGSRREEREESDHPRSARIWLGKLKSDSIESSSKLSQLSVEHFYNGRRQHRPATYLFNVKQKGESLRDYLKCFNIEALLVDEIDDKSVPSANPSVEPELVNVAKKDEDEDLDSLFKSAQDLLKAATSGTSGSGLGSTSQSQFSSKEVSEAKTALRMALLQNFKAVAHPARASNIKKAMDVLVNKVDHLLSHEYRSPIRNQMFRQLKPMDDSFLDHLDYLLLIHRL
ncbi:hypothetical protein RHSIM_Rhsim11G0012100 [Rhododendron simsii]|uniref:Uncharacterized protein n=1 Tax=Rhododendron simsii TaxID=118357 RepID=A0A834G811_RHOSS|nr:hypothetical protein RHSIM_Rhsim11G0012100 [Rhododendron simsii]